MCAGACVCVCAREKGEKERERGRGKRKRRGRARKEEGERERGREEGKERDRKIERERKRDRERMSWSEWWVCLSCWLRYSRCQKFCSKTSGKCKHVAMTAYLHYLRGYRSSRFPTAPHRKSHIFKSDGGRIQHLYIPSSDPGSNQYLNVIFEI